MFGLLWCPKLSQTLFLMTWLLCECAGGQVFTISHDIKSHHTFYLVFISFIFGLLFPVIHIHAGRTIKGKYLCRGMCESERRKQAEMKSRIFQKFIFIPRQVNISLIHRIGKRLQNARPELISSKGELSSTQNMHCVRLNRSSQLQTNPPPPPPEKQRVSSA